MGMFDDLIPNTAAPTAAPSKGLFDDLIPTQPPVAQEPVDNRSYWQMTKDAFTGNGRTEFPDAQEFLPAYIDSGKDKTTGQLREISPDAVQRSGVTPDETAQLDMLRSNIPSLEDKRDKFGNLMLKAPGMADFAYLNKPGFSNRDIDEFGTQTLATLPFLGPVGRGGTLVGKSLIAGGAFGAGSLAQDTLAQADGSQQGYDLERAAISAGLGAVSMPVAEGLGFLGGKVLDKLRPNASKAAGEAAEDALRASGGATDDLASQLSKAFDDPSIVRYADQDGTTANEFLKGLGRASDDLATTKTLVSEGKIIQGADQTGPIANAVKIADDLEMRGLTPKDYFDNPAIIQTTSDPATDRWLRGLYQKDLVTPKSADEVHDLVSNYAKIGQTATQAEGSIANTTTSRDIFNQALKATKPTAPAQAATASVSPTVARAAAPQAAITEIQQAKPTWTQAASSFLLGRPVTSAEEVAKQRVSSAIARDASLPLPAGSKPLSVAEMEASKGLAQPTINMELGGPATQGLARASANRSDEARGVLSSVIEPRFETQGERTANYLRKVKGSPATAYATREDLEKAARQARDPFYKKAYEDGKGGLGGGFGGSVDPNATHNITLSRLELNSPAFRKAMEEAETKIQNRKAVGRTTGSMGPRGYTLEFWDYVKQSLDDKITVLMGRGEKYKGSDLIALKDALVGELDKNFKTYAAARGTAQTYFQAGNALEAGEKFATAGSKFKNAEASAALAKMTRQERELFKEGYVSKLIDTANELKDRRSLVGMFADSKGSRERLAMVLGPEKARAFEAFLHVENLMDLGRKALSGNSTTARQLMDLGLIYGGQGATAGVGSYVLTGDPKVSIAAAMLAPIGRKHLAQVFEGKVALEVAKLLASDDPTKLKQGIARVATARGINALRAFDKYLEKQGIWKTAVKATAKPATQQTAAQLSE